MASVPGTKRDARVLKTAGSSLVARIPDGFGTFSPKAASVSADRILRIQGYSDLHKVRPAIRQAAEWAASTATSLNTPAVSYRTLPIVRCADGELELDGGIGFHCEAFDKILKDCTDVVVFVLTAGKKIDKKVIELAKTGDGLLEALLLETAGWLCLENATREFRIFLRSNAERHHRRITSRLGPGYSYRIGDCTCMWPLQEQSNLFSVFGHAPLPVSLMASGAMLPKMSRSGLCGIRPVTK